MTKKKIAAFGVAGLIVIIIICLMASPTTTSIQTKGGKTISAKTLTFPDGRKYVGELKDGKANGYGILYKADGSKSIEGEFIDGQLAGISTTTPPAPATNPAPAPAPAVTPTNDPNMSKAEFDKIQNGMTYEAVVKIVGGPGEMTVETGTKGDDYYTVAYSFKGENGLGANAQLMFQGGKLNTKAQFGLK